MQNRDGKRWGLLELSKLADEQKQLLKVRLLELLYSGQSVMQACAAEGVLEAVYFSLKREDKTFAKDAESAKRVRAELLEEALYQRAMKGSVQAYRIVAGRGKAEPSAATRVFATDGQQAPTSASEERRAAAPESKRFSFVEPPVSPASAPVAAPLAQPVKRDTMSACISLARVKEPDGAGSAQQQQFAAGAVAPRAGGAGGVRGAGGALCMDDAAHCDAGGFGRVLAGCEV